MLKKICIFAMLCLFIGGLSQALAHTPLCSCFDNGDGTVNCEGGFSDGSSAAGVEMRVEKKDGTVLQKGKMNEFSEFVFNKPNEEYNVVFDAGPGHVIILKGETISE